jgi:hypothetical protein
MPRSSGAVGKETGLSGLVYSQSGQVEEELNPNLVGRKALDTWKEMRDNDPMVGSCLFAIDMLLRQVDWRAEPSEDGNEEDAEFIKQCMDDMSHSWSDFISEVMSMLVFGWAFHEIVYKKRSGFQKEGGNIPSSRFNDGKVGWRKLPTRAQETLDHWEFDDSGGVKALIQKAPPKFEDRNIPIEKGLLFRTSVYKNNPEGRSALRNAYRPWYYKKRIENIEGVGIERDYAGIPIMGVDPAILHENATDEDKKVLAAIKLIGQNLRRDRQEYIVWPNAYDEAGNKLYTFDLLSGGGNRQFDTDRILGRYDQRIAMTLLADFILLGHEKVGSFALSSDKTDIFAIALGTYLDVIEDVLNRFAVPRLLEVNGMNTEQAPVIRHGDIEKPNLTELVGYIQGLTGAGVPLFPDDDLERYLREAANLPEKSEEARQAQEKAQQAAQQAATQPNAAGNGTQTAGNPGNGVQTRENVQRTKDGKPVKVVQQVFRPGGSGGGPAPTNGNGKGA